MLPGSMERSMSFSEHQDDYVALRGVVAEGTQPLAVWIGAGLSVDAGLPAWAGLRERLIEVGVAKAQELESEGRERLEAELKAVNLHPDPWVAFERLQEALGSNSFTNSVRSALSVSVDTDVPNAYKLVWQLGAQVVLTLNLDDFARRAHAAVHHGRRQLLPVDGRGAARLDGYAQRSSQVVVNLHGTLEDSSSWVLTREQLRSLQRFEPYPEFVRRTLHGYTNIFLGMSADDVAVGGHLEHLAAMGVDFSQCYWFSNRRDQSTDSWANRAGMRLIRYTAEPSHQAVVGEFLGSLISARPDPEAVPLPVTPKIAPKAMETEIGSIPAPSELLSLTAEDVRVHLNREATRILAARAPSSLSDYEKFCADYEEAIYRAWYVSTTAGANSLLGNILEEEVAAGAFGRVFKGRSPNGDPVAVKLLRHEIRSKRELLESFRRGVRSMEILHDRGVQSMVEYKGAAEIPSMVVMDWVDGPNLAQAKEAGALNDWDILLKVVADLSRIILGAHLVPERVLHRDLRPANVMLRDFWMSPDAFEVVVLDFDLSWHQGAENRSVQYSTAMGYLAPEQRISGMGSTRRAAVDIYGLGMTFWFLLTGKDPVPDQHMHSDFSSEVLGSANRVATTPWVSLGARFGALVVWMSQNDQDMRPDLPRVIEELDALRSANELDDREIPLSLKAEELAARTDYFTGYLRSEDSRSFRARERRGIAAELLVVPERGEIHLSVNWARTGIEERTGLVKYVTRAYEGIRSRLIAGGWDVRGDREPGQSFSVSASRKSLTVDELSSVADNLDEALGLIKFD